MILILNDDLHRAFLYEIDKINGTALFDDSIPFSKMLNIDILLKIDYNIGIINLKFLI